MAQGDTRARRPTFPTDGGGVAKPRHMLCSHVHARQRCRLLETPALGQSATNPRAFHRGGCGGHAIGTGSGGISRD